MKKSFKIISALVLSSTMAFGLGSALLAGSNTEVKEAAAYSPSTTYNVDDTTSELESYYSSIDSSSTGDTLLGALRTLNSSKRKTTVGYNDMGTSASGAFAYTDYVLSSTAKDSKGQRYGTSIASFYTKTSSTSFNREHTWPKSHGGNLIEGDIHMTRPTISSENSNRGNSFYVEGIAHQSNGWDPYTAGYAKEMRGECARIILYGVVANSSLSLVAADSHSTSNANPDNLMGNMNTLIKWHFDYSPNEYEMNRNNGAQYLQGNRNPFIDHPEYVARIWSNFNSTVSTLCDENASMYDDWTPGSYSSYGTNDNAGTGTSTTQKITLTSSADTVKVGNSITLTATPKNLTGTVLWYAENATEGYVSLSATSGTSITVTGVKAGTETIHAYIGTVEATITITVKDATSTGDGSLVTSASDLSNGDKVVIRTNEDTPRGVTGQNGNKDATVSTDSSEWVEYTVGSASSSGFTLYDSSASKYISSPGNSNVFYYGTTGATCTVDEEGHCICGGRYLCVNGSNYRCYNSIGSYTPFYIYTSGTSTTGGDPTVTSVTVSPSSLSLDLNGSTTGELSVSVAGTNSPAQTVTWSSSNESVATVDDEGNVTAHATGTATITATSTVDTTKKGECAVTVSDSTGTGSGGDGTSYVKVTSSANLTSGQYLIVYESGSVAFDGSLSTLDAVSNTISVTISNSTITKTTTTTASEFTVDTSAGSIKSASGYYIGLASNSNSLTSSSTALANTISMNGTDVDVVGSGGAYLRYNPTSDQARFRYYKSSSYTNQKAIQFYKLDGSSTTEKTLSSIAVSNATTSYTVGDEFVKPTVTATFSDSTTADVTSSATFNGYDMSTAGTQTVNVSYTYGGTTKTTSYTITVSSGSTTTTTYELVTDGLQAGDQVLIAAMSSQSDTTAYTMTNTYNTSTPWYLKSASATVSDSTVEYDSSTMTLWTVGGSSSAGYTFTADSGSNYLRGYVSGTHYSIANLDSTYGDYPNNWSMTYSSGNGYTMSVEADSTVYLEFSGTSYNTFKGYSSAPTDWYMNFFRKTTVTTGDGATTFAQTFLSAITCDSTGANAPTFNNGQSWSSLKTAFNALSTEDQNTLKTAAANESGTDIEKAMARYDYIVAKYGTSTHENFINRTISNSANRMTLVNPQTAGTLLAVFGSVALLGALTFGAYLLKKRKED